MNASLNRFWTGIVFIDDNRERVQRLMRIIVAMLTLTTAVFIVLLRFGVHKLFSAQLVEGILVAELATWVAIEYGYLKAAAFGLTFGLGGFFTLALAFTGGIHNPGIASYILIILLANFLLGEPASFLTAVFAGLTCFGLWFAETQHWLTFVTYTSEDVAIFSFFYAFDFAITAVALSLITQNIHNSYTRMAHQATTFAHFNQQLQHLHHNLSEQAVDLARTNAELQHEIQEREQAELALRESEKRYRVLVEASFQATILSSDKTIIECNEAAAAMFGYTVTEMKGLTIKNTLAPESIPSTEEYIRTNYDKPYEVIGKRKDGSLFPLEVTGRNFDYWGKVARISGLRDLTEHKQAMEALQQAQKMESLVVLAGGVAHDFNNLLVAMLGHTSNALRQLPAESPAKASIQKAVQATERAAALTRQLLAYSGRGHFEKQTLDINQLLQENLHLLSVAVPKQVLLSPMLDESIPLIAADPAQMQQVVMNLILNAAEAIGEGPGVVHLCTEATTLTAVALSQWHVPCIIPEPGAYVLLEVADTGAGIAPEALERIFEPFFTTKFTGRGLGLSAVLGIVRGHRGGIRVQSQLGKGTTFQLYFPVSTAPAPLAPITQATSPAIEPSQGGKILVIDDEVHVREAVNDILELDGYEVLSAASGQEGIALYQKEKERIQLVLLDLSMPGMDGMATFQELQALNPQIRVLLSSGYSEQEATEQFMDKGLAGFLQKPYSAGTLLTAVKKYSMP